MSIFLETERLIIKALELSNINNIFDLHSDPEVMRFIWSGTFTKETAIQWLEQNIQHQHKHGFSFGAVFEKESSIFIGVAGLFYLGYDDTQPDIALAYVLHRGYWGKGYATELSKGLIEWGFTHLPVNKLIAATDPTNEGSRHVLEKIGMQFVKYALYKGNKVTFYEIFKS